MTIGRPTKLTPETIARISNALTMGATYELAAKFGGVSYDTFNNWRKRGEAEAIRREGNIKPNTAKWQKEQPFFEFFEAVQKAESAAAIGWLAKIEKSANDGNWQAAAWKLERRYPQSYGRKVTEHTGNDGGPIEYKLIYPDDD